jgi:hypothetical protein
MLNKEEMYERMCAAEEKVAILAKNLKDLSDRFDTGLSTDTAKQVISNVYVVSNQDTTKS